MAATLAPGQPVLERHEINTRRGVISDQVVDTQAPQASVYLYCAGNEEHYTDLDFKLYGLSGEETELVRDGFAALQQQDIARRERHKQHLTRPAEAVATSARQCCRIVL